MVLVPGLLSGPQLICPALHRALPQHPSAVPYLNTPPLCPTSTPLCCALPQHPPAVPYLNTPLLCPTLPPLCCALPQHPSAVPYLHTPPLRPASTPLCCALPALSPPPPRLPLPWPWWVRMHACSWRHGLPLWPTCCTSTLTAVTDAGGKRAGRSRSRWWGQRSRSSSGPRSSLLHADSREGVIQILGGSEIQIQIRQVYVLQQLK